MKIPLKSVELREPRRGPGPRNLSDVSSIFTVEKTKPGEKTPTPTGLVILWDQEARAVYLLMPDGTADPCVILGWENIARAIPDGIEWMREG